MKIRHFGLTEGVTIYIPFYLRHILPLIHEEEKHETKTNILLNTSSKTMSIIEDFICISLFFHRFFLI